jgi:hypothetical protein
MPNATDPPPLGVTFQSGTDISAAQRPAINRSAARSAAPAGWTRLRCVCSFAEPPRRFSELGAGRAA